MAELLLEGDAQLPPFKLQCQKDGVDPTSLLLAQEPCTAARDIRASLRRWLPSITKEVQLKWVPTGRSDARLSLPEVACMLGCHCHASVRQP